MVLPKYPFRYFPFPYFMLVFQYVCLYTYVNTVLTKLYYNHNFLFLLHACISVCKANVTVTPTTSVLLGSQVQLTCTSSYANSFSWTRLVSGQIVSLSASSKYEISHALTKHEGTYSCFAKSDICVGQQDVVISVFYGTA